MQETILVLVSALLDIEPCNLDKPGVDFRYFVMPCIAVPPNFRWHTMICYAMLCYAMLCYAKLCYACCTTMQLEQTWIARRRATPAASLMTPSPNTKLNKIGLRSLSSTCSTATESVVAKMAPSAKTSCTHSSYMCHIACMIKQPGSRECKCCTMPQQYSSLLLAGVI